MKILKKEVIIKREEVQHTLAERRVLQVHTYTMNYNQYIVVHFQAAQLKLSDFSDDESPLFTQTQVLVHNSGSAVSCHRVCHWR